MILFTTRRDDDGTWFALVLLSYCSQTIEIAGSYDQQALKAHIWVKYKDATYVSSGQFEEVYSTREALHAPEMLDMLKRYGEGWKRDLTSHVVYATAHQRVDEEWGWPFEAIYIQTDQRESGYYTYLVTPHPLSIDLRCRYKLSFVSGPGDNEIAVKE